MQFKISLLLLLPLLGVASAQDIYTLPKPPIKQEHEGRQLGSILGRGSAKGIGSLCTLVPKLASVPGVGQSLCQSSSQPSTQSQSQDSPTDAPNDSTEQTTFAPGNTGGPIPLMQQMCHALGDDAGALIPFCQNLENPVQGLKDLCAKLGDKRGEFGLCAGAAV